MNDTVDQRNYQRFKVTDRAFTKISDRAVAYHVGLIVDISRDGMAFSYLGKKPINSQMTQLDIFNNNCVHVSNLHIKIICDILENRKKIPTRRCGVQFKNLTDKQLDSLENFIQNQKIACA